MTAPSRAEEAKQLMAALPSAVFDVKSMLRQVRNPVPEYRPADEVNAEVAAALAGR